MCAKWNASHRSKNAKNGLSSTSAAEESNVGKSEDKMRVVQVIARTKMTALTKLRLCCELVMAENESRTKRNLKLVHRHMALARELVLNLPSKIIEQPKYRRTAKKTCSAPLDLLQFVVVKNSRERTTIVSNHPSIHPGAVQGKGKIALIIQSNHTPKPIINGQIFDHEVCSLPNALILEFHTACNRCSSIKSYEVLKNSSLEYPIVDSIT